MDAIRVGMKIGVIIAVARISHDILYGSLKGLVLGITKSAMKHASKEEDGAGEDATESEE